PVGVEGELYIGGAGVARGYVGGAGMTAEKFVPDPFSRERGQRLYRSGDICRYQEDGKLEYVRRKDQQVKVRGYRIELGEIESVLGSHEAVEQSVAMVREEEAGDKRLVGYVVMREGKAATTGELRSYL